MSDSLDPRDELTERLADLGRQPVPAALQSEHLTAMAAAGSTRSVFRTSLAGRLKVGAGVLAGFLLGASGLTAAGAMGPLQPAAAKVASEVANVEVPQGPKDKAEKAAKAAAKAAAKDADGEGSIGTDRDWSDGCVPVEGSAKFAGNRGRYLKQERAKGEAALAAAKASTCGMPVGGDAEGADAPKAESTEDEAKKDKTADDANGKSDESNGKSADAPGKTDDPSAAGKEKGDEASEGAGQENKPETPAGPPAEAGNSGVTPPVEEPPAEPAPAEGAGDAEV